jgi:hypothetical protein
MTTVSGRLFAGTIANWDTEGESMAKEIDVALATLMPIPPTDPTDRRRLFVAIARGVLAHLQKNPQAIHVTVSGSGSHGHGGGNPNGLHDHTMTVAIDVQP